MTRCAYPEKERAATLGEASGPEGIGEATDLTRIAHPLLAREEELARIEETAAECARLVRRRALQIHDRVGVGVGAITYQMLAQLLYELGAAEERGDSHGVDHVADVIDHLEVHL